MASTYGVSKQLTGSYYHHLTNDQLIAIFNGTSNGVPYINWASYGNFPYNGNSFGIDIFELLKFIKTEKIF